MYRMVATSMWAHQAGMPKVIAVVGRSRSGKDTATAMIRSMFGHVHKVVRFSAPIKTAAAALFDLDEDELDGVQKDIINPKCCALIHGRLEGSPRTVMVRLSNNMMRDYGDDFFTRKLFAAYDSGCLGSDHIIIPDVRYPLDVLEALKRGGLVIKVDRALAHGGTCHVWEDHIDSLSGVHDTVANNGSPADMERALMRSVSRLMKLT